MDEDHSEAVYDPEPEYYDEPVYNNYPEEPANDNYDNEDDYEEYKWNKSFAESQLYGNDPDFDEYEPAPIPIPIPEVRKVSAWKPMIVSSSDFTTLRRQNVPPPVFTARPEKPVEKQSLGKRERLHPNKQKKSESFAIDKNYLQLQAERRKAKRAKRKDEKKDTVIAVVPRPTLFQQEWEIECDDSVEETIDCETPTFDVIEKITYFTPKVETKSVETKSVETPKVEPMEVECEEDDDDFVEMMVAVQNKKRVYAPKPQVKPVVQFIQPKPQAKPVVQIQSKPQCLEKTRMCFSYGSKNKCPHAERCRFAHNVNELAKRMCRYDSNCRYINADQPCEFWHGQETVKDYCQRLGIKC